MHRVQYPPPWEELSIEAALPEFIEAGFRELGIEKGRPASEPEPSESHKFQKRFRLVWYFGGLGYGHR